MLPEARVAVGVLVLFVEVYRVYTGVSEHGVVCFGKDECVEVRV